MRLGRCRGDMQCAQLSFKFLRWGFQSYIIIPVRSLRLPPGLRLSCPIIVDFMRLSPVKVSHLPRGTPPITHDYRLTFTEASYLLLSHTETVSYFLLSGGLHLILSQITVSWFSFRLFHLQFAVIFPSHCLSVSLQLLFFGTPLS